LVVTDTVKSLAAALVLPIVVLLLSCCPVPPCIFQEGRPAELMQTWPPEVQIGADYDDLLWADGEHSHMIDFLGGAYTGQRLGRFAFEEGLVTSGYQLGLSGAFGLRNPSIALRGSYYPYPVSFLPHGWWQAALLDGFRIRPGHIGISFGPIASPWGLGTDNHGGVRYRQVSNADSGLDNLEVALGAILRRRAHDYDWPERNPRAQLSM
jgi:hypothetical protein